MAAWTKVIIIRCRKIDKLKIHFSNRSNRGFFRDWILEAKEIKQSSKMCRVLV